jgi:hypothetical protein
MDVGLQEQGGEKYQGLIEAIFLGMRRHEGKSLE